jgi:hypothetical protein
METYTLEEVKKLVAYYADKIIGKNLVDGMDAIAEKIELQQWNDGKISITIICKPNERDVMFNSVLDRAAADLGLIAPNTYLKDEYL